MSAHAQVPLHRRPSLWAARTSPLRAVPLQARWLVSGLVLAFTIPFVFGGLIDVPRDAYYAIYIAAVGCFVTPWVRTTQPPLRAFLGRGWRYAVPLGALAGALLTLIVLGEPGTTHPHGWTFAAAILWRGVAYGATDGVLLSVFPILAVFGLFASKPLRERSKRALTGIATLALAVSMLFSAVYHVGYPDFRSSRVVKPVAGDTIWSAPTLLTLSPIGAPIAHIALHVSAVVHDYRGELFLPPHRTAAMRERPALQRILNGLVSGPTHVTPGATAYVSGPNGTWLGSAGNADVRSGDPMPTDARMRLESVSKAWTATLVLQLVGEGKMRLNDTVARWLPGLLPYGGLITVRELLNHTAGLTDRNDIEEGPDAYIRQVRDPQFRAELLRMKERGEANPAMVFSPLLWVRFVAALPLRAQPGTEWHYSNVGYEIAGLIAERVSGKPLATLYRERIIEPLHLDSVAYDPQGEITGEHPRGYFIRPTGTLVDATAFHGGVGAEGGIVSDARDEARFLTALMQGKLLKRAELGALKTPTAAAGRYGLGLVVDETACGIAYQHNGGGAAFKASVFVSGDGRRVAVLLLNANTGDARVDAAAYEAARRLYCAA